MSSGHSRKGTGTDGLPTVDRTIENALEDNVLDRTRGQTFYEQSNHLGNVLTVVSDQKLFDNTISSYKATVVSAQDDRPIFWSIAEEKSFD